MAVVSIYPIWEADNYTRGSGRRKDNVGSESGSEVVER